MPKLPQNDTWNTIFQNDLITKKKVEAFILIAVHEKSVKI